MGIEKGFLRPQTLDRQTTDPMVRRLITQGSVINNIFTVNGLFEVRGNNGSPSTLWSPRLLPPHDPEQEPLEIDENGSLYLSISNEGQKNKFEVPTKTIWVVDFTSWEEVITQGLVLDRTNRDCADQIKLGARGLRPRSFRDTPVVRVDREYIGKEILQIGLANPPGSPEVQFNYAFIFNGKLIPWEISHPLSYQALGDELV